MAQVTFKNIARHYGDKRAVIHGIGDKPAGSKRAKVEAAVQLAAHRWSNIFRTASGTIERSRS